MSTPLSRLAGLLAAGLLGASTPALAQYNGNVEQPSRITTQSGQTTAGPIATSPYAGGSADVAYGAPPVVVEVPVAGAPGYGVDPGPGLPGPGVVVVPVR